MKLRLILACLLVTAACSPAGAGSPTSEPPTPVLPTETPPAIETPAVTETPAGPAVLPAPLLFLSNRGGSDQIWRLDVDGVTAAQLTNEAAPVTDFDASPVDGRLAYVSGNDLIVANADGSGRSVLVAGPDLPAERDDSYINNELTRLRWSPDGARIAYGLNGVNVIDAAGGTPIVLQQSDPAPQPPDYSAHGSVKFYWPNAWSPDGSRLLIDFAFWPEGGGLSIIPASGGDLLDITSPQGLACCDPSWSIDGAAIYYSSSVVGLITSGLWRADASTGQSETLIEGVTDEGFALIGWAKQAGDGKLYYFYATGEGFPEGQIKRLAMARAEPDGVTGRTPLRDDAYVMREALWAPGGSGAVVIDVTAIVEAGGYSETGPALYLKSDGSPAAPLIDDARLLRWGK